MRGWRKPALAWLALAVYLLPATAFAQATKAGVVTTLEGNVTAARAVAPQPVVLKFKDDVFLQDRVVTGEQSFARLLLGGKAVISIRERSAVTITEVPGRSTIDIESGKIALSVARDRMQPGEVINIKTPNAVAGVRGTVVVAQVAYSLVGGARQPASNLWVLRGVIEAVHTNAAGVAIGVPVPVGAMQSFSATPTSAATGTFTLQQMSGIVQGLQAKGTADPGTASQGPARLEAVNTAVALLAALTGSPAVQQLATGTSPEITTPAATQPEAKITEAGDITSSPVVPGGSGLPQLPQAPPPPVNTTTGPDVPDVIIDDQFVQLVKDQTLKTFSGTSIRGGTSPVIRIVGSSIIDGPESTLVVGDSTANATLQAGPLMKITDSTLDVSRLLLVQKQGTLTSLGASPLIALDPVTVNATTLIEIEAGGRLSLVGPLLTDLNGRVTTKQDAFSVGGSLTGTGAAALVGLQGTILIVGTAGIQSSVFKITGPVTQSGGTFFFLTDANGDGPIAAASALVSLQGPLISSTDSTISAPANFIAIGRSILTSTSPNALIQLSGSKGTAALQLGGINPFGALPSNQTFVSALFSVAAGAPGTPVAALVSLAGPLLEATSAPIQTTADVVGVFNGASVSSTSPLPFIKLNNTPLSAGAIDSGSGTVLDGRLAVLSGIGGVDGVTPATLTLSGPFLRAENGSVIDTNSKGLAIGPNGVLSTRAPLEVGYPLVVVDGLNTLLSVGSNNRPGRLFEVVGAGPLAQDLDPNPVTGAQSTLLFGQQTPLQHKGRGALLQASNSAFVNVRGENGNVLRLDTALLEATGPIILLMTSAKLQTNGNGIDLASNARLQSNAANDALVRIDSQARMDVLIGHLVNVSVGRIVAGDLVRMGTNTQLNIPNGFLLNISNGAIVSLASLVRFTDTGATLSVTNGLAPTRFDYGIPIYVAPGAVATIPAGKTSGAILGLSGNTLNVAPGSSLVGFTGTGGTLKIGN